MQLKLLPVVDVMTSFYQMPLTPDRFQEYLKILEGGKKGELLFPVSGFNPMAKGHVLDKLNELRSIGAEEIMKATIAKISSALKGRFPGKEYKVALNLSDDLKGGWTNRFTSDYDSKFRISGLMNRGFCVPVFWSSEQLTEQVIQKRTAEYIFRTIYRIDHPGPVTLHEHVAQESFVAGETRTVVSVPEDRLAEKEKFYALHGSSGEYAVIFNFFYGDRASEALSFAKLGNDEVFTGFDFAAVR